MIIHGVIQEVQFNAPKEGAMDARTGEADKGLYVVYWTDASRPSELRCTQTFTSYAGADSVEHLIKEAGTADLADTKVTVAVTEFKVAQGGGFYVRGPVYFGHLTGEQVQQAKRGTLPSSAPAPLPKSPKAA